MPFGQFWPAGECETSHWGWGVMSGEGLRSDKVGRIETTEKAIKVKGGI